LRPGLRPVRHAASPWGHLDTCQFRTTLTAEVPRVQCPEPGVLWLAVPRAERGIAR